MTFTSRHRYADGLAARQQYGGGLSDSERTSLKEEIIDAVEVSASANDRATFTAGENIAANDILFIKTDGKVYKASALSVTSSFEVGIAVSAALAGNTLPVDTRDGKVIDGFSGLTAGTRYFLSESYGKINSVDPEAAGSLVYQVGIAQASDKLLLKPQLLVRK